MLGWSSRQRQTLLRAQTREFNSIGQKGKLGAPLSTVLSVCVNQLLISACGPKYSWIKYIISRPEILQ